MRVRPCGALLFLSLFLNASAPAAQSPAVKAVTVSPSSVTGGQTSSATVTLTMAPGLGLAHGVVVTLSSSDEAVATVPANLTFSPGMRTAAFTITTHPISTLSSHSVTISAFVAAQAPKHATLVVLPPLVKKVGERPSLMLRPCALASSSLAQTGATPLSGCVLLTGPAPSRTLRGPQSVPLGPAGARVRLASSNPAVASVPATLLVPGGRSEEAFKITTVPVDVATQVIISAHRGSSDTASAKLTVLPPKLMSLTLSPSTISAGGSVTLTASLTGPAYSPGIDVTLSSSNSSVVPVPSHITVQPAQASAQTTLVTNAVQSSTPVVITGSFGGATRTATLTVLPLALSSFDCTPSHVTGGGSAACKVSLNGPSPSPGTVVNLSSSNPAIAAVPAGGTVQIPAGNSTAEFTVITGPVSDSTNVTVTASYGSTSLNYELTVDAASLKSLLLDGLTSLSLAAPSASGLSVLGKVLLTGEVPPPGTTATVTFAGKACVVFSVPPTLGPATVQIPGSGSNGSFNLTVYPCPRSTQATSCSSTFTATYKGQTASAQLTVNSANNSQSPCP